MTSGPAPRPTPAKPGRSSPGPGAELAQLGGAADLRRNDTPAFRIGTANRSGPRPDHIQRLGPVSAERASPIRVPITASEAAAPEKLVVTDEQRLSLDRQWGWV